MPQRNASEPSIIRITPRLNSFFEDRPQLRQDVSEALCAGNIGKENRLYAETGELFRRVIASRKVFKLQMLRKFVQALAALSAAFNAFQARATPKKGERLKNVTTRRFLWTGF
jgi:hypothetical protein